MRLRWLAIGLVSLIAPRHAAAELWSSLESYVFDTTLIVKARAVRRGGVRGEVSWTFEPVETWKGVYRPSAFVAPAPGGGFHAAEGEHGVIDISTGTEVVFFFDARDRSDGKISAHSTAFPIRDDSVVYASTAHSPCAPGTPRGTRGCRETYSTAEFKRTIVDLVRAQAGCGDLLRIRSPRRRARRLASYLLDSTSPDRCGGALSGAVHEELERLGRLAVPHVAATLRKARLDESIDAGVQVLARIGARARPAVPTLLAMLERCDVSPRWSPHAILTALGTIGDRRAIEPVRTHLASSDDELAVAAAGALGELHDRGSFDDVAALLPARFTHAHQWWRVSILLEALHGIDARRARPLIERAVNDPVFARVPDRQIPRPR